MRVDSARGSQVYTPLTLKLYDWWVLSISNRFVWRCPTEQILLPHFQRYLATNHLDIGVGTGYYPAQSSDLLKKSRCWTSILSVSTQQLNVSERRA